MYYSLVLGMALLSACSVNETVTTDTQDAYRGYFSDASNCSQAALLKETVNVPTAGSISAVEIPVVYDANRFLVCMEYAKRPVSRIDPTEYLNVSKTCLSQARGADNADLAFADCVKRSRLSLEIIGHQ